MLNTFYHLLPISGLLRDFSEKCQHSDSSAFKFVSIFVAKLVRSQKRTSSESATKNANPVELKLGSPVSLGRTLTFELLANLSELWSDIRSAETKSSIGQTTIRLSLRIAQKPNSVNCDRLMKLVGSSNNLETICCHVDFPFVKRRNIFILISLIKFATSNWSFEGFRKSLVWYNNKLHDHPWWLWFNITSIEYFWIRRVLNSQSF